MCYNWIGSEESTVMSEAICIMNVLLTAGDMNYKDQSITKHTKKN